MSNEPMLVTIYSREAFSDDLRDTFKLPGDPYAQDAPAAMEYLKNLKVVHYRDEFNIEGIIFPQDDFDVFKDGGWEGFRNSMYLDLETYEITVWEEKHSRTGARERQEYIEKAGNDKAWLVWNKEVIVSQMDETSVQLA